MTTKTKTTLPVRSREAKAGWRTVRLVDLFDLKYGYGLTAQNRTHGEIPVYGSSGIVGFHDNAAVKSPGVILGRKGNVGAVHYSPIPFYPIDTVYFIDEVKQESDIRFLYYLLSRVPFRQIGSDVGVPGLNRDLASQLEVNIPVDINTQKRIAEILSAFDEKIENNNRIIKTLEEMAQAIFKEWFIRNAKGKNQKVKLSDLIKVISGYPFPSGLYVSDKTALGVVTIKNVQDGDFVTSCDSFIRKADIPKNMSQECVLRDGDILLSLTGNVGRVCFVYGGEYLLNQRVAKLKPKDEKDLAFSYFLFRQVSMQNQLINMAKGSAQPNLSPVETGEIEFANPSREALDKFSEVATSIYQKLVESSLENQKLTATRDLLLPKLMSGEIRV